MNRLKMGIAYTLWSAKFIIVLPYFAARMAWLAAGVAWDNYSPWGEFYKKKINEQGELK